MTQPAPQALNYDNLVLRIADEAGVEKDNLRKAFRTAKWVLDWAGARLEFEATKPLPGRATHVVFGIFHGCAGDQGEQGTRLKEETRVYAAPLVPNLDFLRLTYVPMYGQGQMGTRHERLDADDFVSELAEEVTLALDGGGEELDECPACGEDVKVDDDFCASCGAKLPGEEEEEKPAAEVVPPEAPPS